MRMEKQPSRRRHRAFFVCATDMEVACVLERKHVRAVLPYCVLSILRTRAAMALKKVSF